MVKRVTVLRQIERGAVSYLRTFDYYFADGIDSGRVVHEGHVSTFRQKVNEVGHVERGLYLAVGDDVQPLAARVHHVQGSCLGDAEMKEIKFSCRLESLKRNPPRFARTSIARSTDARQVRS